MYILTNALKNLVRNRGRNLLLGSIISILILTTTIALVINSTSKGIIEDYRTRFGSEVTLNVDFDKLMAKNKANEDGAFSMPIVPTITPKQYMTFADSKYIKSYKMDMSTGVIFDGLKAIDEQENENFVGSVGNDNQDFISPKAKLLGYANAKDLPDFSNGLRKLVEGKVYQNKNECLVSSEFANLNKLKVGDTFQVADFINKKTITLKVTGIFVDLTKANGDLPAGSMSLNGAYGNRRNEILVNLKTLYDGFDTNSLSVNAEYVLTSPEVLKPFEKELRSKGLPSMFDVQTDEASYNKIVGPVVGLTDISLTFMWIILAVGCIVLLFITSMAIRERKYEIGVLRAMGMKKAKVAIMLITEMICITSICVGIGLLGGNLLSQPVADQLIEGQVEAAKHVPQDQMMQFQGSVGQLNESDTKPLSEIDVSLSGTSIVQIILIALLLALLSSASGVIFITKYEPMRILSERN